MSRSVGEVVTSVGVSYCPSLLCGLYCVLCRSPAIHGLIVISIRHSMVRPVMVCPAADVHRACEAPNTLIERRKSRFHGQSVLALLSDDDYTVAHYMTCGDCAWSTRVILRRSSIYLALLLVVHQSAYAILPILTNSNSIAF